MKKILTILLAIGFSIPAFAGGVPGRIYTASRPYNMGISHYPAYAGQLQKQIGMPTLPEGFLFIKYYQIEKESICPISQFAIGQRVGIFTRATSASAPKTWMNSSGIMQLNTASNTLTQDGGYYDGTSFHAQNSGITIEAAGTNKLTYSNVFTNVAWVKTTVTVSDTDAGSTTPDGSAISSSLTASAGNGMVVQPIVDAAAGIYTASVWLKRKTGTGTVNLRANILDSYSSVTVTSSWARFNVHSTSKTNPAFDLQLVTNADAVYIYGAQLEKNPYPTSYIPTTTAALTRGAEVMKFETAGNRNASQETVMIKFVPKGGSFANDNIVRCLLSSDNKKRYLYKITTLTAPRAIPNFTDSSSVWVTATTPSLLNTSYVITGVFKHSSPYVQIFTNGVSESTYVAADFITPAWGTYFYLGVDNSSVTQLNGGIQKVVIFSRALSAGEVAAVSNLMALN